MVPIHLMRGEIGRKFDAILKVHGGYWHAWGTGNRQHRRMMAAIERSEA